MGHTVFGAAPEGVGISLVGFFCIHCVQSLFNSYFCLRCASNFPNTAYPLSATVRGVYLRCYGNQYCNDVVHIWDIDRRITDRTDQSSKYSQLLHLSLSLKWINSISMLPSLENKLYISSLLQQPFDCAHFVTIFIEMIFTFLLSFCLIVSSKPWNYLQKLWRREGLHS